MVRGYAGKGSFRAGSARPSADSFRARFATCNRSCPSPTGANENTSKFMRPLAAYSVNLPVSSTSWPTATCTPAARKRLFHIMHGRLADLSLTVKYTALYPGLFDSSEISPTRHTVTPSSAPFASCMAADTDKAREADSCVEAPPLREAAFAPAALCAPNAAAQARAASSAFRAEPEEAPELAKTPRGLPAALLYDRS